MRDQEREKRSEWLWVRVTAEEAAHVASTAAARGLTVSDLVRGAVLRQDRFRSRVGPRALPADAAEAIRRLGAIGKDLRRLAGCAQVDRTNASAELQACLAEARAAIAVFGP